MHVLIYYDYQVIESMPSLISLQAPHPDHFLVIPELGLSALLTIAASSSVIVVWDV